jgi:hypothetical protein
MQVLAVILLVAFGVQTLREAANAEANAEEERGEAQQEVRAHTYMRRSRMSRLVSVAPLPVHYAVRLDESQDQVIQNAQDIIFFCTK